MKAIQSQPHTPSRVPHDQRGRAKVTVAKSPQSKIIGASKYVTKNPPGSLGYNPKVSKKATQWDTNSPYGV